jgi:hypothetical protein
MVRFLARVIGIGTATADMLVQEVLGRKTCATVGREFTNLLGGIGSPSGMRRLSRAAIWPLGSLLPGAWIDQR